MAAENIAAARRADCCPSLCDKARSIQRRPSANWLCQYQNGHSVTTNRKPSSVLADRAACDPSDQDNAARRLSRSVRRRSIFTGWSCPSRPPALASARSKK